jgi:predicted ATPase
METLEHATELAQAGHGQIVAAVAESGVGKSRLFFEFKAKHQSGRMVLEAFSVSYGKASAYLPVLDLLHSYFDIKSDDDARKRREKVTGRGLALDRSLEDTLPYLFALLGIVDSEDALGHMDAQVRKRRTLDAIKRILLRESLNQPLMVIFEDLHWIDDQTQEFLNLLADSLANAKILLLVNYRPEYSHQWGSKTYYTQLRLDPLGKESAEEMLSARIGDSPELAPLKQDTTYRARHPGRAYRPSAWGSERVVADARGDRHGFLARIGQSGRPAAARTTRSFTELFAGRRVRLRAAQRRCRIRVQARVDAR